MATMQLFYPFNKNQGTGANAANWGKMARLWAADGVVAGEGNELNAVLGGGNITLDTGAVWVEGFYGENLNPTVVTGVSNNGLLTARLDYQNNEIGIVYQDGTTVSLTQIYGNVWDIPLYQISNGVLVDQRSFTSPTNTASLSKLADDWVALQNSFVELLGAAQSLQQILPAPGVAYNAAWITTGSGAVQPVLNTGSLAAFFSQAFTMVTVNFVLDLSTTSTTGVGDFLISLPYPPAVNQVWYGKGMAQDSSANLYPMDIVTTTQTGVGYMALYYPGGGPVLDSGGDLGVQLNEQPVTGLNPFTPSGAVSYSGSLTYEIAH